MDKGENREVSYTRFRRLLFKKGDVFRYIPSGSFFELPIQYFISHPTDIDVMFALRHLYASVATNQMSNTERSSDVRLIIETKNCHIGFARLRQPKPVDLDSEFYRKPKRSDFQDLSPCIVKTVNATESSNCNILPILLRKLNAVWGEKRFMKFDKAYTISCPSWPDVAKEWKTRKRTNGWPPDDVRENVVSLGCHFVSKPHKSNPTDDTQWRFSFSLAELILIQHWTRVQTYIYHILRLIKSEIVKACGGENETVLCTYFFKTLMLWACEEKSQEFWREENIETAVGELLCIMIEWLIEKRVPNYFIPGNNMIDHLGIDDDLSIEISLLSIHMASYLDTFRPICNASNSLLKIPISFHLPKELIDLFSANISFHAVSDSLATGRLNSLSASRTFLPGLLPLFYGLSLQKNITCEPCEYSSNDVQMAIRYFESAMRSEDKFSLLAIDCGKSVIANMSSYLGVYVKENCSTQLGTAEAEKDIRISTGYFGTSNLSRKKEIIINLARHIPSPTLVLIKTYYANFLYATLKDYTTAFELCRKIDTFLRESDTATIRIGSSHFTEICIPLSNKWSALFDIHIQAVLGFLNIFSAFRTKRRRAIVVNMNVVSMLDYIRFQSARYIRLDEYVEYVCNFGHAKIWSICGVYRLADLSKAILMAAISASGIKPTRNGQTLAAYHFLS